MGIIREKELVFKGLSPYISPETTAVTFDYKQGRKIYIEITWDNGKLESKIIESGAHFVQICQFSLLFQVLTLPFGWRRFWCWEQNQALVLRR